MDDEGSTEPVMNPYASPTAVAEVLEKPRPEISAAEWGLLLTLAGIQLTNVLDFVILMPLGPRIMHEFHVDPWQFSILVSAYGFASSVASIVAALVLDRFDRKKSLLALYAGFIVATAICAIARNFETMLIGRIAAGAFGGVLAASVLAIVGDVFADYRRGTAMGVVMSAFSIASIVGIPLGLMAAERYGSGAPFGLLAGICLLNWVFAAWALPALRGHMQEVHVPPLALLWSIVREPNHWRAFTFMVLLVLSTFMVVPYIATYVQLNVGRPESEIKYIYLWGGICTLISMNLVGRLSDRFGKLPVFRASAIATVALTMAVTTLPPSSLLVVLLVTTAFMVTSSSRMVPAQAMITGSAGAHLRGGFLSVTASVQHLAIGLATLLAGALMGQTPDGKLTGFWLVGVCGATAALAAIVVAGQMRSGE